MGLGTQVRRYESFDSLNSTRIQWENEVSQKKNIDERKMMGQFSTPPILAKQITDYLKKITNMKHPRVLEPACGSGAFIDAITTSYEGDIGDSLGIEIDEKYYKVAETLYTNTTMFRFVNNDYLRFIESSKDKFDLIVSNPPYIRHQKINSVRKETLKQQVHKLLNIQISGLSDYYIPFILLSDKMIYTGGYGCWLIPSEFLSVNYGEALKQYLCNNVTLISIHKYSTEKSKFDDAQVSSCVILYKKEKPNTAQMVTFSTGDDILKPNKKESIRLADLNPKEKWMKKTNRKKRGSETIGNYFVVKRGLATGDNDFFILNNETIKEFDIEPECLVPIMPSPRWLKTDEIESGIDGIPNNIEQLFLLKVIDEPEKLEQKYPNAWTYIKKGVGKTSERYLNKKRKQWYFQEDRLPAPIVLAYMSRRGKDGQGYRFIRNRSQALSTNSYLLLYPKQSLTEIEIDSLYERLLEIEHDNIDSEGREYGGGLKKVEPKELLRVTF